MQALSDLSNPDETGMGIAVISVPERRHCVADGEISEGVHDQLDGGRGICREDQVEIPRVCIEEAQRSLPYGIHSGTT